MDLSGLNTLMVLLWKNFILKRRQFVTVVVEIILTLLFAGTLLLTRRFTTIKKSGPFSYSPQPVDELPLFFRTVPFSDLWELAFVPSKSVVVKGIVETVIRDLNLNFKDLKLIKTTIKKKPSLNPTDKVGIVPASHRTLGFSLQRSSHLLVIVQGFSSESDFEDYVEQENNSRRVLIAFIFDHEFKNSHDPLPLKVKYSLRLNRFQRNKYVGFSQAQSWETDVLFPISPSMGPRNAYDSNGGSPGYIKGGFLFIQHALDKAIMKYHNHRAAEQLFDDVSVLVQRFPHPIYYHDNFFRFFGIFVPLVILMIFSMNHFTLVQSIVWEKENRLKEFQLVIGLRNWMLWAAYFFTFLTFYSVVVFLLCLVFFVKMKPVPIIQYSDPSLVFVFLLCFAIATIFFSFMVSTFFNKGRAEIETTSVFCQTD